MDALKRELEKKRKAVQADFGQSKYVKRADLERKKLEQKKAEEEQERERKFQLQIQQDRNKKEALQQQLSKSEKAGGKRWGGAAPEKDRAAENEAVDTENEKVEKLQLPRNEVIRRLRMLKQPVTLFGEDDEARLVRLEHIMRTGEVDPDGELLEGQRNDFLRDIIELKKGGGAGGKTRQVERGKKDKGDGSKSIARKDGDGGSEGEKGAEGSGGDENPEDDDEEDDVDAKRLKANFDELCTEDKILVFFKKLLKEWKHELDMKPEAERRTIRGKKDIATYKQCARYLEPMFKMCRRKHLDDDIRAALLYMVNKCKDRDYLAATDKYIKLAIGNAPWPIGVTMVGIHERSAREKIHTNSVAHIMNDETTRKYLQSVKRLMTLCQRRYPAPPSKSVEFNSLANGSDLEALLEEEARKGGQQGQQALLRLTATKSKEDDDEFE